MSHTTAPTQPETLAPHINVLRGHLLATLADLRSRSNPMEPDRARAVATVASVLVDTAKVEIDYLRLTGNDNSGFIDGAYSPPAQALPAPAEPYKKGVDRRVAWRDQAHLCG
jgi:hypothetical protein